MIKKVKKEPPSQQDEKQEVPTVEGGGEGEITPIEQELAKAQEELKKQKDNFLYLMADFDNYKKRAIKERSELMKYGNLELIRAFLNVVDTFEMMLDAKGKDTKLSSETILEGARLAMKQFQEALQRFGVQRIESLGKPFDPFIHEAIGCEAQADVTPETVIKELQKAYKIHEKVLRPARVIVSMAPTAGEVKGEGNE